MGDATECNSYSCKNSDETLAWIKSIIDFITPFSFLINSHVVNFFTDRLWLNVDKEWMDCLRGESVQNLILIPSGVIQDHWPTSLKNFILKLRSMAFRQEQADIDMALPGLQMTSLNSVLAQGMNVKKKHEVEVLSAVVSTVADSVRAHTIVDVGAGQGYLAQVLAFLYQHPVIAIDACSHHGRVTGVRAERIKKHYTSQMLKSGSGMRKLNVPKTITCRVLSIDTLKTLVETSLPGDDTEQSRLKGESEEEQGKLHWPSGEDKKPSTVLAGLHACGDLSVTMLKTFLECEDVKAVVSLGCCYNLLSEESIMDADSQRGFPMSQSVRSTGLSLGKSARDLACQSAERWRSLDMHAGIHNFELHAFRAAFQMVLSKYYPEVVMSTPSIGRKGKALRRRQQRRSAESQNHQGSIGHIRQNSSPVLPAESENDGIMTPVLDIQPLPSEIPSNAKAGCDATKSDNRFLLFKNFCRSGLSHLGIEQSLDINLQSIWKEAEPFSDLIGPYWSLRAALGPLLETLILLDRLLFLQEQGSKLEAYLLPIFDPNISPRNVAIIAKKVDKDVRSCCF
ncbi:putative Methyltransferase domain-containing protein [Lupinus albus]|uniref:Putative Methyltransferase domain-containing protein n=1 Tax=Lupinus albus TaxID=3870 RepID=A0A6A4N886_LUPAL|nr:putative Methyltransferase domain-containing protein [Lupinus albus]